MASIQEAEIIFAQKLASNEKPIRSKALLKLRKYISVRSQRAGGGFTEEELLKIWKGLFYCVWMQDMPLLQEELSTKISALLHSFHTVDSQLLYFKTFLQTMKREWNGIDRLRMDKFYQLVRFVFRQVFEMLKRTDWQSSLVKEFLELFSEQLLQASSAAPSGLLLHVLDLYVTELALIGSAELSAEQNLQFIEPFCKTMSKTKDRVLLKAISSNIFDTIVDQVPFAIEDLLREIHQDEGQESDCSDGSDCKRDSTVSGHEEDSRDLDQSLLSDDMSFKDDQNCGPVLQFDYGAIADRLFQLASRSNILSFNRSKIYKFVKTFRDLSEGVFPQDEVEVVSSDEEGHDDRRRRRKRKKRMNKGQKDEQPQQNKAKVVEGSETIAESETSQKSKQEKKKGKKKHSKSMDAPQTSETTKPQKSKELQDKKPLSEIHTNMSSDIHLTENELDVQPVKKNGQKKTDSKMESDRSDTDLSATSALQKKKLKTVNSTDEEHNQPAENCTQSATVSEHPKTSTLTPSVKKRKTTNTSTEQSEVKEQPKSEKFRNQMSVPAQNAEKKGKKHKHVALDGPESDGNGELHMTAENIQTDKLTDTTAENTRKKRKRKQNSVEVIRASAELMDRKSRRLMNGHTETSEKRPRVTSESEKAVLTANTKKTKSKAFQFCQKKAPAPIFCKATGFNTPASRKKSLLTPKSESKKVTFGLKNNKTMEFRKMDQSSMLSPAGQSQVAFDPKKTPKFGVLKSPTSSPALRRRSTAADFF